ncbi:MAG TPA: ATP-binding protein [Succinivibrionaceae bacterium]|nr:ATP-binding protein [Succinivibrionaceae bacterium]
MALYLNVGNESFQESLNSIIYVDKSPLIEILNRSIKTKNKYFCLSRPRRFGKSVTAQMICSYYAKGQDCSPLFDDLEIASFDDYKKHLNQYDVISINISDEFSRASHNVKSMTDILTKSIVRELKEEYPNYAISSPEFLDLTLQEVYNYSKVPFVFVIDEWDCIMREKKETPDSLKQYLEWLKAIFKDKPYVGLAYMTGILPVKKYGSHSALNMFTEYSMTEPLNLGQYIGFTENEVKDICKQHDVAFNQMQQWYDGYSFKDVPHIYNPNSVVNAATYKKFISYWTKTETFESLQEYIDMNMEGLRDDIVKLIAGEDVIVDVSTFSNDMVTFHSKDDVLTLLIHLGYLAIKGSTNLGVIVHIPNEEIKLEFKTCVKNNNRYAGVYDLIKNTDVLLNDIWSLNSEAVAKIFDEAHQDHTSILTYNNENSLANVIAISLFLSTTNTYNVVRELPTGKGYADLVYLPKPGVNKPALLIELKFDKSALTAITQIKEKNYLQFFKDYKGEVLLVGINYSKDTKTHQCIIERAQI